MHVWLTAEPAEDSIQKISRIAIYIHAVVKLVAGGASVVCFQYPAGAKFPLDANEPAVDIGCDEIGIVGAALRVHGRIVACGCISSYNDEKPRPSSSNLFNMITKRLTMKGLLVSDWLERRSDFENEVGGYLRPGRLRNNETVVNGLDHAVGAFLGFFRGQNIGKMVVKLDSTRFRVRTFTAANS